jgi:hypothetical protein
VNDERASQDESRREQERALRAAAPGPERGAARLAVVAAERRRGQLDLAALALEEAIREGGPLELAGAELGQILAQDPRDPGARRALACFAAVRVPSSDPFPDVTQAALRAVLRANLFRSTFRSVARETVLALEPAVLALAPGRTGSIGREKWSAALGRAVDDAEARALDALYGRLLGAARRRVVARLDTPGPLHEMDLERFPLDGDRFDLAFAGEREVYLLGSRSGGTRGGEHVVHWASMSGAFASWNDEEVGRLELLSAATVVLEGVKATPLLVATPRGAFVVAVDDEGELQASLSGPSGTLSRATKRVGRGVSVSAACACDGGFAIFLDHGSRMLFLDAGGAFSHEKRLAGHQVLSVASRGDEIFVLARAGGRHELLRLGPDLVPRGEPTLVPRLEGAIDARVVWPTPEHVFVLEPPGTAHAFHADDGRLAWTARVPEPLDDLEVAAPDGLELVTFGRIESEWGQGEADVGIARWTRDGLGRHGPTVRVEVAPSGLPLVKLASRGAILAIAYRGLEGVTLRFASLAPLEAVYPAAPEWTFASDEAPPPDALPIP